MNQNEQQPGTSGKRIRANSLDGPRSTSSMSEMSAQTSDTNKTAESKFGDYVTHRLELQPGTINRRRLEAAIQQTISNFEINQLENE